MTENERIRMIRKSLRMTCEEFGEKLGVSKVAISNIENGNRNITNRMEKSICREFNVNAYWLDTGNGEMFIEPSFDNMDFTEDLLKPENEEYLNFFKECMKTFTREDWEDIKRLIKKSSEVLDRLENNTLD